MDVSDIDFNKINSLLGYDEKLDESTKEVLLSCEEELKKTMNPLFTYKIFDLSDDEIKKCEFKLVGKSIKEHLKGCSKVAFICATLSSGVDVLIRKKTVTSMAEAHMIDSVASIAIEQVLDKAEEIIMKDYIGCEKTSRFGLGYGDFPITGQKQFLEVLNANNLVGVCVNEASMLTPTKSVTCIIGISEAESD